MNHVRSGNGKKQLALNRVEMADVESVRQNQIIQLRSTMPGWHVLSWVLWDVFWARGRLHQYVDFGPNIVFLWVNI